MLNLKKFLMMKNKFKTQIFLFFQRFIAKYDFDKYITYVLDSFPQQIKKDGKTFEFHVFKRKEGYMIDYKSTSDQAYFFTCGTSIYKAAELMNQVLKYHKIL